MSQPRAHIKVTFAEDGKTPVRVLVFDGVEIGRMDLIDVIELLIQAPSTIRWEDKR
jgi:hypothetical protein